MPLLRKGMNRTEIAMTRSELKNPLSQFSTQELEKELLNRQKCHFGRLTCTNQAQDYMTKSQIPTCFNCKQDTLSLLKSKDHE